MAAIADIIEGVRWQEDNGLVTTIDRAFIVKVYDVGFPDSGDGTLGPIGGPVPSGFPVYDEVMKMALEADGIPAPGEVHPIKDDLFCTRRVPMALGVSIVKVTCTYTLPGRGSFDPPFGSQYRMSGGTSVEQVETSLFNGTPITVQGPGGVGDIQTGSITPFEGRAVLNFGASFPSLAPWVFVEGWVNKVNSGPFFYSTAPARTWLITEMNFELEQRQTPSGYPIYSFSMSMAHNPDTWDPGVIYLGEDGRPPQGLVAGVGYKTIMWHAIRDFDALFQ